MKQQRR